MALTSNDVNNQSFSISRKGYDVEEVDVFLENVASSFDELYAQIDDLMAQLADAQAAPADEPIYESVAVQVAAPSDDRLAADQANVRIRELEALLAERRADDSAISQALIVAQRSADEIIAKANGTAETTRQDAESEAQRILDKANAEKQRVLEQIRKLEEDREAARDRFTDMLNDFIGNSQDLLSDLHAGKAQPRASHGLPRGAAAGVELPEGPSASTIAATYTTPTVSPVVVAPTSPKPSKIEKDFSGFGDTDDGFEYDDVD